MKTLSACIATLLACAGLAQAKPDGQPPIQDLQPAFIPVPVPPGATPTRQTVEFTAARIDLGLLSRLAPGEWFALNVTPTRTLAAKVEKVERRLDGCYSIIGSVEGDEGSILVLAVEYDAVAAMIQSPTTRETYRLKYVADGVHLVCAIDPSQFKPCGGSDQAPPPNAIDDFVPDPDDGMLIPPDPNGEGGTRGACNAPQTVFDGMIAYTDDARAAAGGANAINAECQAAVDVTNLAYTRSGVAARYRLVWRGEVAYAESGNSSTDLGRLQDTNDGFIDGLHTTRDSFNADFLTLWVDSLDACGRAYCTSDRGSAMSVVQWECAAGNFSHPHEVGHNQGCDHNPEDGGGCSDYSYGYGHRFFVSGTGYRTIMSYNNDANQYTRIGYFSNPNVNFNGVATGTASRDNARVINNTRGTCENFELTRMDVWVQIGWAGVQIGTYALPYNAVSTAIGQIQVPGPGASEDPNLYIKSGTSTYTGTITKRMTIRACGGIVNIGGNP